MSVESLKKSRGAVRALVRDDVSLLVACDNPSNMFVSPDVACFRDCGSTLGVGSGVGSGVGWNPTETWGFAVVSEL